MNILEKILQQTRRDLTEKMQRFPLRDLAAEVEAEQPGKNRFRQALEKDELQIIAEIKKASPSKGLICAEFDPQKIAVDYEMSGAAAISVLTEPHFFQGSLEYLQLVAEQTPLPLLRKDFIVHEYQIYEAALQGASAFLLIVAALSDEELSRFLDVGARLHLDALVEVHDEYELERAVNAGAEIIGINNRDLTTFTIDRQTSLRLIEQIPEDIVCITESGISTRTQLLEMQNAGFSAALIGEVLMRQNDRVAFLKELRGK